MVQTKDVPEEDKQIVVYISPHAFKVLQEIGDAKNIKVNQVLAQAIATEYFLWKQFNRGAKLLLKDGEIMKELIPK